MASPPPTTSHKFVVVLNKKIEPGVALNATAHMVAALMARADDAARADMQFLDYVDKDGHQHPVSGLSLIVLRADNANKIRAARQAAIGHGILHVDFTASMTGDSYVEQMERTRQLSELELDYFGLAMFGPKETINLVTSRFSLWR